MQTMSLINTSNNLKDIKKNNDMILTANVFLLLSPSQSQEFSLAYTKIASAAQTHGELPTGREVIDLICEPVSNDEEGTA